MGVFNGVTTWVEGIVRPRGIDPSQAGLLGAIMLVGGVVSAVAIPALSDRSGRRRPYIVLGLAGQCAVALVFAMEALNKATGSFTASLSIGALLLAASAFLALLLSEPGAKPATEAP